MTNRMTRAWFLAGPLVMMGATWLAILVMNRSVEVSWSYYLNHASAGLLGGLVVGRATTGRNRTAQVLAAYSMLVTIGVFTALFVVRGSYYFSWAPDRSDTPWLLAGVLAAVSIAAALGGVALARSWRAPHAVTRPDWVMVSSLIIYGALTPIYATGAHTEDVAGLALFGLIMAGGGLVQLLVPRRAIWLCSSGALMFCLIALDRFTRDELTARQSLLATAFAVAFMWPLAALGARIAWRFARPGPDEAPEDQPEIPAARVQ
jgi:hypothetical protein